MAKPERTIVSGTVAEILEHFMDWTEKNRPKSYEWYKKRIDHFYPKVRDLRTSDLRPLHIQQVLDKHDWSDAYKAGCVTAMKRAFNWGLEQGYIDHNPLRGLKKPDPGRREQIISEKEFEEALACVPNQSFHDIAGFIWFTGCRPEEAVKIEAAMCDLPNSRIIIPRPEAKKKKRPRVIYLCEEALEIVNRNIGNLPTLFLNTQGRPWTAYSIANTWGRIEKKTGKRYCSYALRHSYITHKLKTGTDTVTLAHLVGHEDTSMISKVYGHVGLDPEYMRSQARRNAGS
jgi:integrase